MYVGDGLAFPKILNSKPSVEDVVNLGPFWGVELGCVGLWI